MTTFTKRTILSVAGVIALGGCSTITTGTTQDFAVETPHADGARCILKDTRNAEVIIESTPKTLVVSKGDGPMNVTCSKAGFQTANVVVEEGLAGMTAGNILLGGGVGIIIDAASGAAQEYPDSVVIWMEPEKWATKEAKDSWTAEKAAFDAEQEAKKHPENEKSTTANR